MFELIKLPYAPDALAPVISAETLAFHHGKHLQTYVNNLNAALPGSGMEAAKAACVTLGICGQLGVEYTFTFPLAISLDVRPQFGYHFGDGGVYSGGLYGFIPTLGVRYRF